MANKLFILIFSFYCLEHLISAQQCLTSDQHIGHCVHYTKCEYFNEIANDDNRTDDEVFYLQDNLCMDDSPELVCCKKLLPNPITECGTILFNPKIINGTQTPMFQHPWAVPLYYSKSNFITNKCGGSLINTRYVVTAAHCVHASFLSGWKLQMVKLGVWNISATRECSENGEKCADHVSVGIEKTIIHENFNKLLTEWNNDIALLRLNKEIKYSDFVRPICLPPSIIIQASYPRATAVGWGRTENGRVSTSKMHVNLFIVKLGVCQRIYKMQKISDIQICAISKNKDTCDGDSGGPLLSVDNFSIPNESYLYLTGVVSYGPIKCGSVGKPGVYTNVSKYIPWIKSKLRP